MTSSSKLSGYVSSLPSSITGMVVDVDDNFLTIIVEDTKMEGTLWGKAIKGINASARLIINKQWIAYILVLS